MTVHLHEIKCSVHNLNHPLVAMFPPSYCSKSSGLPGATAAGAAAFPPSCLATQPARRSLAVIRLLALLTSVADWSNTVPSIGGWGICLLRVSEEPDMASWRAGRHQETFWSLMFHICQLLREITCFFHFESENEQAGSHHVQLAC